MDTRKTLSSIPESAEAPSKKYFSLKTLPYSELLPPNLSVTEAWLLVLPSVLETRTRHLQNRGCLCFDQPRSYERDTFEKICY
jgi:hypothetical protein